MLTVDSCVPGDVVTISGVVKVMGADDGMSYTTYITYSIYALFTMAHFC